jgi:hypothetical protein
MLLDCIHAVIGKCECDKLILVGPCVRRTAKKPRVIGRKMIFLCPHCNRQFQADTQSFGRIVACPYQDCQRQVTIPYFTLGPSLPPQASTTVSSGMITATRPSNDTLFNALRDKFLNHAATHDTLADDPTPYALDLAKCKDHVEEVVAVFAKSLTSSDRPTQMAALNGLTEMGDAAAPTIDLIISFLDDEVHCESALRALAAIGPAAKKVFHKVLKIIKSVLENETSWRFRDNRSLFVPGALAIWKIAGDTEKATRLLVVVLSQELPWHDIGNAERMIEAADVLANMRHYSPHAATLLEKHSRETTRPRLVAACQRALQAMSNQ